MDVANNEVTMKWNNFYYIGLPVSLFILIVSIYLWSRLQAQEMSYLDREVAVTATNITQRLEATLIKNLNLLTRLGSRWDVSNGMSEKSWYNDVNALYQHSSIFKSIEYVDNQLVSKRIVPQIAPKIYGGKYNSDADLTVFFEEAKQSQQLTLSNIMLGNDNHAFIMIAILPVYKYEQADGYLMATIGLNALLNKALSHDIKESYGVALYHNGKLIFSLYNRQKTSPVHFKAIRIFDNDWKVSVWPSAQLYSQSLSTLPVLILIIGSLISALVAVIFYFYNALRSNALRMAYAETNANKNAQYLKAILQTVNEAFITIDKNNKIVDWNLHAERMFGWSKHEVLGKLLVDLIIPKHYRELYHKGIKRYLDGGHSPVFNKLIETSALNRIGQEFPIELVMFPLNFGNVTTFHAFIRDITLRKYAEADQSRLASIVEGSDDAIISTDLDGLITSWNKGAYKLLGYKSHETIGLSISIIYSDLLKNKLTTFIERIRSGEHIQFHDTTCKHKDTQIIAISILIAPIRDNKHKIIGSAAIIRDISERKKIEKMKNEFISIVSHELRTPLTSIRGALGLLASGQLCQLSDKVNQLLGIANNNSERLIRLINDILDIEKIESGKMEFNFKATDISKLIHETVAINQAFADKHQIQIEIRCDEKWMVIGDHDRLLQVMTNLLSNAIRYSPVHGLVNINVRQINDRIRVSVVDHGPGVPKHFEEKIFGKFAQADSSSTRKKGGTGLGLNISKAIIEKHHGNISFYNNIDQGVTFYFDLPSISQQLDATVIKAEKSIKVLICDDNKVNASRVYNYFASELIMADIAHDADHAKDLLIRDNYHAIFMDLSLPNANGIKFVTSLRQDKRFSNIPFIIASIEQQQDKIPIVDWITKPVTEKDLANIVEYIKNYFFNKIPNILSVEDDLDITRVISLLLQNKANVWNAKSIDSAKELLANQSFDLIVLDLKLPDGDGTELLPCIDCKTRKSIPVIVFSVDELQQKYLHLVSQALLKSKATNMQLYNAIETVINAGL